MLQPISYDDVIKKWEKVLDVDSLPKIGDYQKRMTTAVMLENATSFAREQQRQNQMLTEAAPVNSIGTSSSDPTVGPIDYVDPVLISLIRRTAPNMIAYDLCGTQPLNGPTGLIFAMRSRYNNQTGPEALWNEANTSFTGIPAGANVNNYVIQQGASPVAGAYTTTTGYSTALGEGLGSNTTNDFPQMAFSIERISVTAFTRKLKAEYSMEMAHDLKQLHGLDAEKELANILSTELLSEINREIVRTINATATVGAASGTATPGTFDLDVDSNGRWLAEKFVGLTFALELESNAIELATRRGRGNVMIASQSVASALRVAGRIDTSAVSGSLNEGGIAGNSFVGTLGGMKVYVDPYFQSVAGEQYATMGYKGGSAMDAGLFYCPYVPLTQVRAQDPNTFQPKIGFMTRYGMVANPFATAAADGAIDVNKKNVYYRRMNIMNIM